jgi:hypothetical protein
MQYPAKILCESDGCTVTFPDVPEAITCGDNEMLLQKVRPAELAKRLDIPRQHVNRLLDPRHATKIDGIAAALKVLGKTLEIRDPPSWLHPAPHVGQGWLSGHGVNLYGLLMSAP